MGDNFFTSISDIDSVNFADIEVDPYWNVGDSKESKMHSIHAYPAKFPAFIADKSIDYYLKYNKELTCISDIFCGCGTVALVARKHNIDFWGCDINPVATLIAKTKSNNYSIKTLKSYYGKLLQQINETTINEKSYEDANERLKYWFSKEQYLELNRIKEAIDSLSKSKYQDAFLCIFSSILKPTSRWLTKSIKPQVDPNKKTINPMKAFCDAAEKFIRIIEQEQTPNDAKISIYNCNFLSKKTYPEVDLIITSPPYVTSYEYADLHQLSTLWLGYVDDYKELRKGTIGSVYNSETYYFEIMNLNSTAKRIVEQLCKNRNVGKAKAKSVARYFIDMQNSAERCYKMLSPHGIACFVIGDTEYKSIRIENAKHLVESLLSSGFTKVKVSKRIISNKTLSPYRDVNGKFSSDATKRKVYHEEYVVIAHKGTEGKT